MTLDELRAQATDRLDGWHRWPPPHDNAAVTLEEAELLHALVRATRPGLVLELGTGLGISGSFIADALRENGGGELVTVEPLAGIRVGAEKALAAYPNVIVTDPDTYEARPIAPDLVFIDSSQHRRPDDIRYWLGLMSPALIVVHDAHRAYPELSAGHGTVVPTAGGVWIGHA